VDFKKLKRKPTSSGAKRPSLNRSFFLALASVLFCWFYGVPALVAAFFAMRDMIKLRKGRKPGKGAIGFKMRWGYFFAWSGLVFSTIFTVIYFLALVTGSFIRI
jgi:hypothetical protein